MAFEGVDQYDSARGVWSPTENRWISNDEIRGYFASNPNLTADQIVAMGGQLGLNPYAVRAAVWQGQGGQDYGTSTPEQQKLANAVNISMDRGTSGFGAIRGGGHTTDSTALVAGSGLTQYRMPDGSLSSVDVQNYRPTQSYADAVANYRPGTDPIQALPEDLYSGGNYMNTQGTGTPAWANRPTQPAASVVTQGQTYGNVALPQTQVAQQQPVQPVQTGFQTPMLDALYAAQQRRMLSSAPVFNFQNAGALTQAAQEPYMSAAEPQPTGMMNTAGTGTPAWAMPAKAEKGNVQTPYSQPTLAGGPQQSPGALTQAVMG